MVNKSEYLKNPCRMLSIPYWKMKSITIPDSIEIIHIDDFNNQYESYNRYFRIKHNLKKLVNIKHTIFQIDLNNQIDELIEMINNSYKNENIEINKDDILRFIKNPTYRPNLWIYIKEDNRMVASGIGEYDEECNEGIIEWIQVLPDYRNKGYAQDIVNALLKEFKKMNTTFVTVSGNLDNITNPERLYRKCGFKGNDVWFICNRR